MERQVQRALTLRAEDEEGSQNTSVCAILLQLEGVMAVFLFVILFILIQEVPG
jgi:hypothetical protein